MDWLMEFLSRQAMQSPYGFMGQPSPVEAGQASSEPSFVPPMGRVSGGGLPTLGASLAGAQFMPPQQTMGSMAGNMGALQRGVVPQF